MHVRRGLRGAFPLRGGSRGGYGKVTVQRGGGHDTGETRCVLTFLCLNCASYQTIVYVAVMTGGSDR